MRLGRRRRTCERQAGRFDPVLQADPMLVAVASPLTTLLFFPARRRTCQAAAAGWQPLQQNPSAWLSSETGCSGGLSSTHRFVQVPGPVDETDSESCSSHKCT